MKIARFLAKLLDRQFTIGNISFGIDPLLGLVPGIGDTLSTVLGLYLLHVGTQMKVSRIDMVRMAFNIFIDFLIGLIPLLGDIFDVGYKANIRNLKILEKYAPKKYIEGELLA